MIVLIGTVTLIYLICMFFVSVHKETKDLEAAVFMLCVGLGLIAIAICFK